MLFRSAKSLLIGAAVVAAATASFVPTLSTEAEARVNYRQDCARGFSPRDGSDGKSYKCMTGSQCVRPFDAYRGSQSNTSSMKPETKKFLKAPRINSKKQYAFDCFKVYGENDANKAEKLANLKASCAPGSELHPTRKQHKSDNALAFTCVRGSQSCSQGYDLSYDKNRPSEYTCTEKPKPQSDPNPQNDPKPQQDPKANSDIPRDANGPSTMQCRKSGEGIYCYAKDRCLCTRDGKRPPKNGPPPGLFGSSANDDNRASDPNADSCVAGFIYRRANWESSPYTCRVKTMNCGTSDRDVKPYTSTSAETNPDFDPGMKRFMRTRNIKNDHVIFDCHKTLPADASNADKLELRNMRPTCGNGAEFEASRGQVANARFKGWGCVSPKFKCRSGYMPVTTRGEHESYKCKKLKMPTAR